MGNSNRDSKRGRAETPWESGDAPRILLIDDDPTYGKIMERIAEQSKVALTYCKSLDELGEQAWWRFDAAIVDYDLGTATGLDLIKQLESYLGACPVILISQTNRVELPVSRWPVSVKGFMSKTLGHFAILEAALAAHDMAAVPAIGRR